MNGTAAAVARVLAAARRRNPGSAHVTIAIDGPSGTGKSTLADELARRRRGAPPTEIVRLDEVYPGWFGLAAAAGSLDRTLLAPLDRGVPGSWRRWDWALDRPAELEQRVPRRPLVVEGCGAFEATAGRDRVVRVWLRAGEATRKRRALDRDAGAFDPFWDVWETQWRRYVHRTSPLRRAHLVLELPEAAPRGLR